MTGNRWNQQKSVESFGDHFGWSGRNKFSKVIEKSGNLVNFSRCITQKKFRCNHRRDDQQLSTFGWVRRTKNHVTFSFRRFIRQQSGMDDITSRSRPKTGDRRIAELWQVRARAPVLNWKLHAGRVARRWPIQEGNTNWQPKLFIADTGRRRRSRNAGECVGNHGHSCSSMTIHCSFFLTANKW